MSKLSDLTPDQAKTLTDFDLELRQAVIVLFKALRLAGAAAQQYNAAVLPVISQLDGTEPLPTSYALTGGSALAKADPGFLVSYLQAVVDHYNTTLSDSAHMALYVKAAGSLNLVGQ